MGFLDFIFPKHCVSCKKLGDYICADCFSFLSFDVAYICLVCNRASIDGLTHPGCLGRYTIDGAFSSISYNRVAKKLVYAFKYKPYVSTLKSFLIDLFYEGIIQNEQVAKILQSYPLFIPIPLHISKLKSRGYNQSQLLAQGLSKKLNIPSIDILVRVKNTFSQVGLDQKKRKDNVHKAFSVVPNILLSQYPNIFLVDDVLTSGSTLLEAARVLKRHGAKKVWGVALARD